MKNLIKHIQSRCTITQTEINSVEQLCIEEIVPAQTKLLKAGMVERHLYFLSEGIVKGYQNVDGKNPTSIYYTATPNSGAILLS